MQTRVNGVGEERWEKPNVSSQEQALPLWKAGGSIATAGSACNAYPHLIWRDGERLEKTQKRIPSPNWDNFFFFSSPNGNYRAHENKKQVVDRIYLCMQTALTRLSINRNNLLPFNVSVGGSNVLRSHPGSYLMRIDDKDYTTRPLTSIGGLNASHDRPFQLTTTSQLDHPTKTLIVPFLRLTPGFTR